MPRLIIASFLVFFNAPIFAKDLGVHGNLFEIREKSLLVTIYEQMSEIDWEEINRGMVERFKEKLKNMPNESGLSLSEKDEFRTEDMSIVINEDIWAPQPNGSSVLIAEKGMKINPFEYSKPIRRFFFFSTHDPVQVEIAEKMYKKYPFIFVPVVVDGDVSGYTEKWKASVFYSYKHVAEQLRLRSYPSLVGTKDKMLAIYEFNGTDITLEKVENAWGNLE